MKKIIILLILYSYTSSFCMEQPVPRKTFALKPDADFFATIPAPVRNIVMEYLFVADKSCKEVDKAINALGRTNKAFSQSLLYDSANASKIIHTHAQRYKAELDAICPYDPVFAAGYQLNTFGARKWLKEQYFADHKNFKIISAAFFEQLNTALSPRTIALKQCMLDVLPKPKKYPPIIQRRLNRIRTYAPHQNNRYTPETKKFMELLNAQIDTNVGRSDINLVGAICRQNPTEIDEIIAQGVDVDCENLNGKLPLMLAIRTYPECIPQLLQAGANPNNREKLDPSSGLVWTPLQLALSQTIPVQYIENLLVHGANPKGGESDYGGKLIRMAIWRHPEAVKVLLRHNVSLTDKGLEEIEYAKTKGKLDAVAALEEYREKRWPAAKSLKLSIKKLSHDSF